MILIPAIDLYQGRVVRLERGDYARQSVYSAEPGQVAREWEAQGADWIHVVDLEGARSGRVTCLDELKQIRASVHCRIEFGGGVRDFETLRQLAGTGVDRVVIGTKALDGKFLDRALHEFGGRLAVGIDIRDGYVRTQGWLSDTQRTVDSMLEALDKLGVKTLIVTDIRQDGMLQGPNLGLIENVLAKTQAQVVLSGGIASLEDIRKIAGIRAPHFEGAIIGKALYERKFELKEAIQIVKDKGARS
ncbi:MAG: 1-(5-phosphoribosyl)-5-[(5-phosphoribosylamino)methylideneamino]imidazole-4-carboxamide isomerase [Candidatus Omnitrophota bacterium]